MIRGKGIWDFFVRRKTGQHDVMMNAALALAFMFAALYQPLLELRIQHRGIALDRARPSAPHKPAKIC